MIWGLHTTLYFASALVIAILVGLILRWDRGSRASFLFSWFGGIYVVWIAGRGLLTLMPQESPQNVLAQLMSPLPVLTVPMIYNLICLQLRVEEIRRPIQNATWIFSIGLSALMLFSDWIVDGTQVFPWGPQFHFHPVGWVQTAWAASLLCIVLYDYRNAIRDPQITESTRTRLRLTLAATLFVSLSFTDFINLQGYAVYPLSYLTYPVFFALMAAAARRGLLDSTLHLAAERIAEMAPTAVLVVDPAGVITYANTRAQALVVTANHSKDLVGSTAQKALGAEFSPERLARLSRSASDQQEHEVVFWISDSERFVDLSVSVGAVPDRHGADAAYVCTLRDVTADKAAREAHMSELLKDTLTGLPNRAFFVSTLDVAVRRAQESTDAACVVCLLGVDRMRNINQDLGYATGDRILTEVGARLRSALRTSDLVARLQGDEFGILLRGNDARDPLMVVEKIKAILHEPLPVTTGHQLSLSASIGVASSQLDCGSGTELLRHAGIGLHQAKLQSNGIFMVEKVQSSSRVLQLESDLRAALSRREFEVFFQPIVHTTRARIVGFEALIRWNHPVRGRVLPGEFMDLAEEINLLKDMDLFVLQAACSGLSRMQQQQNDTQLFVSINMSERRLLDSRFVEDVGINLQRHGLSPAALRIELIEQIAMSEPVRETLLQLRNLGTGLYIDDFGTGYSSLSRLHGLPITGLKIDRDFVTAMSKESGGEKIISSIAALAQGLGLDTVAEGVERAEELQRLAACGCEQVQGFYFTRALPLQDSLQLLANAQWLPEKLGHRVG